MSKPAEIELAQLKTAVDYLASVLEEGSLVGQFDKPMRREVAAILRLLLNKVEDLPTTVPEHLIQATAVRAIIDAAERVDEDPQEDSGESLKRNMRQAEVAANLQGHTLGEWEPITDSGTESEYQAVCHECEGIVYVNPTATYSLMLEDCPRSQQESSGGKVVSSETIVALWDLAQKE